MAESPDQAAPGRARETGPALEFHYRFPLWLARILHEGDSKTAENPR